MLLLPSIYMPIFKTIVNIISEQNPDISVSSLNEGTVIWGNMFESDIQLRNLLFRLEEYFVIHFSENELKCNEFLCLKDLVDLVKKHLSLG